MVSSVVPIFFLIMYHNCERCQNRTIAKMSLAASRTESVGILGRRLWRHLHSLLWSDHARLCREELYLSKHPDRLPYKCTCSTVPDKWHYSIGPSCTANILIRFPDWKKDGNINFFFHPLKMSKKQKERKETKAIKTGSWPPNNHIKEFDIIVFC